MMQPERYMTIKELREFLLAFPQDIQVAYVCCSEQCLLDTNDIKILDGCEARADGWIQDARPDKPPKQYLLFPGN